MILRSAALSFLLALAAASASAQPAPPSAAPTPVGAESEPRVVQSKIEDDNVKIEELRVRGESRRLVVSQKKGELPQYEIIPEAGGRDPSQRVRGTGGQRVWNVFSF